MPELMIDGVPIATIDRDTAQLLLKFGYESPGTLGDRTTIRAGAVNVVDSRPMGGGVLRRYEQTFQVVVTLQYTQTHDRAERA